MRVGIRGSWLEITWQNVLLGALALIGTTALTILVTRVVNWLLDRRSRLIIEVEVNEMFRAQKVANDLKDQMRAVVKSWEDLEKLPLWKYGVYSKFFASEQYLKVSITNSTPKKVAGLTFSLDVPGGDLIQVGSDGDLIELPGRTAVLLGDLQPKRSLLVNVLTSSLFSSSTMQVLRERIVITSDEHVRTRYKFPAPAHIQFRDKLRRLAVLNIVWVVFLICALTGFLVFASKH
jgi:hypothetical protein